MRLAPQALAGENKDETVSCPSWDKFLVGGSDPPKLRLSGQLGANLRPLH